MPVYRVTPEVSAFSCAAGEASPREDGLFEIERGDIVAAMQAHGLAVELVPEAPPSEPAPKARRTKAAE